MNCGHIKEKAWIEKLSVDVVLPQDQQSTSLPGLLKSLRSRQRLDGYKCDSCESRDTTLEKAYLKESSKYLIVQVPRVGTKLDKAGRPVVDINGNPVTVKVNTKIKFPIKPVDLMPFHLKGQREGSSMYEVFGVVEHGGEGYELFSSPRWMPLLTVYSDTRTATILRCERSMVNGGIWMTSL